MSDTETEKLIDPDCRDGKHGSCVGGPCECACHQLCGCCGQRRADGRTHGREPDPL